jgi:ribonuclease HI
MDNEPRTEPARTVIIYTDGGADPNTGAGGWAAIVRPTGEPEQVLTGGEPQTTNNRMELTAAIRALQALPRPSQVELHTDSQYLRKGITEYIHNWERRDWKTAAGKPVQNEDLWRALWPLVRRHDVRWHWVAGHRGEPLNERVDALARQARLAISPAVEVTGDRPRLYLRASCQGNPGPGAWAVVLEEGEPDPALDGERPTRQFSGAEPRTTNNRMELAAAVEGLRVVPAGGRVEVVTTSDYLAQGATRWLPGWRAAGWRKKDGQPVANADLWGELDRLQRARDVRWKSAKGQAYRGLDEAGKLLGEARR